MLCPICKSPLEASRYEGLPVFSCGRCHGYLVASRRAVDISHRHGRSHAELEQEAECEQEGDTFGTLKCPRCYRPMDKEMWSERSKIRIDKCPDCKFVWFDGGELAKVKLEHDDTAQGQEYARFQERIHRRSEQEEHDLEQRLAELPEGEPTQGSGFGQGLIQTIEDIFLGR